MSDEKKIYTYGELEAEIRLDTDLQEDDPDEQFVTKNEMIGYCNSGILKAQSEIMTLQQDYFLTKTPVPLISGQDEFDLPSNIFANKLRGVVYKNGPIIYPVRKFKTYNKFESIAFGEIYSSSDDYRRYLKNDAPGQVKMVLVPPARETAILPPLSGTFTPMYYWYIRNANRVPIQGEYTNAENILSTSVDTSANTLAVSPLVPYVTGDQIKLYLSGSNTLPSPLLEDTIYYAIAVSDTSIKLATSASNASAGTAIDLTTTGSDYFTMRVAATDTIIDATIIDIPEFYTFIKEWVKANCIYKDGDPRLPVTLQNIEQEKKLMIDTLVESEPDNDDTLSGDFTPYNEMS
jgi:hypothetical protein